MLDIIRQISSMLHREAGFQNRLLSAAVNGSTVAIAADEVCTLLSLPPRTETGLPCLEPAFVAGSVH